MLERRVEIRPAWDKRSDDPKKNYGIHSAELAFYLTGPKGVMQFIVYTGWHLRHVAEDLDRRFPEHQNYRPLAADLGYHSYAPMYEGQTVLMEECPLLNDKPCYYDGSSLNADRVFNVLVQQGSEAVWKELENEYACRFLQEVNT